jgi:hypothetical protein
MALWIAHAIGIPSVAPRSAHARFIEASQGFQLHVTILNIP